MKPLIAVAQMKSGDDVEANFQTIYRLCEHAKQRGAQLVCFPENFAFLSKDQAAKASMAEPLDGPLFARYRGIARKFGLEISFGGFQELASQRRVFNTHVVVDASGEIASTYRKIHLFVVDLPDGTQFDESADCEAGGAITTFPSSVAKLGLSICYDLRFPELYQALRAQHAELLLVPAAFTAETGKAHWEVLLRARAIENQCYVAAAAQYGLHYPGRATHGHAMIVDPWGSVIAQCSDVESLTFAEIDLDYLNKIRTHMPVMSHKRPDLFSDVKSP